MFLVDFCKDSVPKMDYSDLSAKKQSETHIWDSGNGVETTIKRIYLSIYPTFPFQKMQLLLGTALENSV